MLKLVRRSEGLLHQLRSRVGVSGFCSSSTGARKPLGDQKTLFYQHHKKQQRTDHEDRFERKQFHRQGYARPGAHLGNFGGGGFDPKALRVRGSFGRGGGSSKPIDWKKEKLTTLKKDFYEECAAVTTRSDREIEDWISKHEVTLDGVNIPRPVFFFEEAGFPTSILQRLKSTYETPTVIQSISWPIAMSGRDIISIAKTGSGKTVAFTLPGIVHTLNQAQRTHGDGPTVLVMLPTRELAQQVQEVATPYCRDNGLSLTCVFGGSPRNPQVSALRQGVDVLIGTPGRLRDFLDSGITNLRRCSYVNVLMVEDHDKPRRLLELLETIRAQEECKTIVFCETKRKCDELTRKLRRDGWPCLCIHGDKGQSERDWVMKEFKGGKTPLLLATDVAARGLDVDDIKFVVNYDYPNSSEDYVHRIGRTGRRDKKGSAYTFFSSNNASKAADLIRVLSEAHQEVPADLQQMASSSYGPRSNENRRYGSGGGNRRYGGYGGGASSGRRHGGRY
uniref:RNA helicase n=1 Tax=Steinernema glaseri TaxID=37863 RepID=A0A1I7YPQ0_9BILA